MDESYSSGAAIGTFLILGALYLGLLVLLVASQWKIFVKAGKPGWAAIIPIYNVIILLEIVGKPVWWVLLYFIPVANLIFAIWTVNLLSKSFGQDVGFTLGMIFLGFIFYPLLAFGKYTYQGPAAADAAQNYPALYGGGHTI